MHQAPNETCCRSRWPQLLMALPEAEVMAAAEALAVRYRVEDVTLPQAGLGLLQLRDGAFSEAYYLGEIPLASAHLTLTDASGNHTQGAAQIMHDSAELARAIAVIDAVLAADLPGRETVEPLLRRGAVVLERQRTTRKKMLSHTRVDFSLLGIMEDEASDD